MSLPITAPSPRVPSNSQLPLFRRIWFIAVAAFLLRICLIIFFRTYDFPAAPYHYGFGFETGSIAASLATRHGFSSPFGVQSGPTTWIAPIYPALLAGIFKTFGLFSAASAIVALAFNSLCAALTVPVIFRITRRVFDLRSAEVAAWIWALVPLFSYWTVTWVWETAASALLCAIAFCVSLELESGDWRLWAALGVLWGFIGLTSPSLFGFLPASFLYPALKLRKPWTIAASRVLIATVFFSAAIAPWLVRNQVVFHKPIFIRGNFFFEMSLSNYHLSTGEPYSGFHPVRNQRVLNHYVEVGEPQFVAEARQRVSTFIRTYPTEFLHLTAIRFGDFWDGEELMYEPADLPIRRWMIALTSAIAAVGLLMAIVRRNSWGLFAWLFILYPIPYYLTSSNPRYRHPIEPMMVALTGFFFVECWRAWNQRRAKQPHKAND